MAVDIGLAYRLPSTSVSGVPATCVPRRGCCNVDRRMFQLIHGSDPSFAMTSEGLVSHGDRSFHANFPMAGEMGSDLAIGVAGEADLAIGVFLRGATSIQGMKFKRVDPYEFPGFRLPIPNSPKMHSVPYCAQENP